MAWTAITTIAPISNWVFTKPVEGSFFRLKHSSFPRDSSYEIAQAELGTDGTVHLFDIREMNPCLELQTVEFKKPGIFGSRRIAVRRVPKQPSFESELRRVIRESVLRDPEESLFTPRRVSWQIAIEVSDYVEPAASTTTSANTGTGGTSSTTGGTNADPYFSNIALLMHFDGANNSTVFADVKGKTITIGGSPQIKSDQSKFGGASGYFNGSSYLSLASSSDFNFDGDFTIEMFVQFISLPGSNSFACLLDIGGATAGIRIGLYNDAGTRNLYFNIANTTTQFPWSPSTNTWYHLAISRSGSTVRGFVDGVVLGTQSNSLAISSASGVRIAMSFASTQQVLNGYLDELRITKGIARYTAAFTPPSLAFPNS